MGWEIFLSQKVTKVFITRNFVEIWTKIGNRSIVMPSDYEGLYSGWIDS